VPEWGYSHLPFKSTGYLKIDVAASSQNGFSAEMSNIFLNKTPDSRAQLTIGKADPDNLPARMPGQIFMAYRIDEFCSRSQKPG